MRIRVITPVAVRSLPLNTEPDDSSHYCEVLENILSATEEEVRAFLLQFISTFFRCKDSVQLTDDLYKIEFQYYSTLSETPVETTTYGSLFIDKNDSENSGLSDCGLCIFFLGMFLGDPLGIETGDEPVLLTHEINMAVTVGDYIDAWVHVLQGNGILKEIV